MTIALIKDVKNTAFPVVFSGFRFATKNEALIIPCLTGPSPNHYHLPCDHHPKFKDENHIKFVQFVLILRFFIVQCVV